MIKAYVDPTPIDQVTGKPKGKMWFVLFKRDGKAFHSLRIGGPNRETVSARVKDWLRTKPPMFAKAGKYTMETTELEDDE